MSSREQWLDITKGFAILLVVIGHVLIGFLTAEMYPQMTNPISYVVCTLYSFHMPLFFAISGYLYGRYEQRATVEHYYSVAVKKLTRLGIPFLVFSLIQGLVHIGLNRYTNHTFSPSNLLTMIVSPFDQFWFLYALLAIFLLAPLLELLTKKDGLVFSILLALKYLPALLNIHIPLPFFEWFMAYGLYFYAGTFFARHAQDMLTHKKVLGLGSLVYIALNAWFYSHNPLNWVLGNPSTVWATTLSVLLAFSGILFGLFITQVILMATSWSFNLFNLLGLYSFEIYLLHTLPSAAMRIILQKFLHTDDFTLHLSLAVLLGIIIPVFIGKLAKSNKALEFLFYPGKYLKGKPKQKPAVTA